MARRVRARPELIRRHQLSEPPFGTIKRAMNQGYFLMKGLHKVGKPGPLLVPFTESPQRNLVLQESPWLGSRKSAQLMLTPL